jgi:hypothetical protein
MGIFVQDANNTDVTTNLLSQHILAKKVGMREKSRQMLKYVHEQRAARTLSIVVGVFLCCWAPFFLGMYTIILNHNTSEKFVQSFKSSTNQNIGVVFILI